MIMGLLINVVYFNMKSLFTLFIHLFCLSIKKLFFKSNMFRLNDFIVLFNAIVFNKHLSNIHYLIR